MQKLIISLLLLVNFSAMADGKVRFAEPDEDIGSGNESIVQANDGGASFFYGHYEASSSDGTSVSSPSQAWLPFKNVSGQENNVTISNKNLVPNIGTIGAAQFQTLLRVTNTTGSDRFLYAAVQDPSNSSNYLIVSSANGPFSNNNSIVLGWQNVLLVNLCNAVDCTNLQTGTTAKKNVNLYYFLDSQSNRGLLDSVTPSGFPDGVFLKLNMSVAIPSSDVRLNDLRRGDGRLTASFTGSTISEHRRTLAVVNNQTSGMNDGDTIQTVLAISGSEIIDLESTATSGEVTIKPLVNGVTYEVALLFEDKYQLATRISEPRTETPQAIEALLEKQACYILSAGFGQKHFITDYFRKLRDKVLFKTALGTSFVDWYYKTAPRYAPYIYSSPALAFVVRCFAFMTWFLINLGIVLVPIVSVVLVLKRLQRNRNFHSL